MRRKIHLSIIFIAYALFSTYSQVSVDLSSPQVSDFMRYTNTSVTKNTGRLDFSINLMELVEKDFQIPVKLGYNSAGFMPAKNEGIVGLNWFLNVGGCITREVNGIPDDLNIKTDGGITRKGLLHVVKDNLQYTDSDVKSMSPDKFYFNAGVARFKDSSVEVEPDIYHFSFCGYSGKFVIGFDGKAKIVSNGSGTFGVDFSDYNYDGSINKNSTIKITADNGYSYYFGGTNDAMEYAISFENDHLDYNQRNPVSSFHLSKIVAPNGNVLTIEYEKLTSTDISKNILDFKNQKQHFNFMRQGICNLQLDQHIGGISISSRTNSLISSLTKIARIKTISTGKQKINFYYSDKQSVYKLISQPSNYSECGSKLDSMTLCDNSNKTIKKAAFEYQYEGGSYPRLFMKTVTIQDQKYAFTYYGTNKLPTPVTRSIDHWGYWNDQTKDADELMPTYTINTDGEISYQTTQRDVNTMQTLYNVGLLSSVTFPTGGSLSIEYERHDYSQRIEQTSFSKWLPATLKRSGLAGGARVKSLTESDNGSQVKRIFEYLNSSSESSGTLYYWPKYSKEVYSIDKLGNILLIPISTWSSSNLNPFTYGNDPVLYSVVKEIIIENTSSNAGPYTLSYFSDYNSNPNTINTVTNFDYSKNIQAFNYLGKLSDQSDQRGKLLKEEIFENKGVKVQESIFSYANNTPAGLTGIGLYCLLFNIYEGGSECMQVYSLPLFSYNLIKKITNTYDKEGKNPIESIVSYVYNNQNLISQEDRFGSDFSAFKTSYTYPLDYSANSPYKEMVMANILSPVVEKKEYKETTLLSTEATQYSSPYTGLYLPLKNKFQKGATGSLEDRVSYLYDSKGNIREIIKDNAEKTVYLWSYNYQYPVAEIKGVTYEEVKGKITGGEATINTLASSITPDLSKVEDLRASLGQYARVTTYTYRPLVGILTVKDPRGVTTSYDYDTSGRLKQIKQENKIVKEYEYNYKQ